MEGNPKYTNLERSRAIVRWLDGHQLISRSALCSLVDYSYSDFEKAQSGAKPITGKFLEAFEEVLKKYGYMPPVIDTGDDKK